jgi:peptidoglycan/LPS O-acetylase OafA/YrhL
MNPPAKNSDHFYRPELDVLRFIAFFLVLILHTSPPLLVSYTAWSASPSVRLVFYRLFSSAGFGLSIFFCLSAYLIATLLLRERSRTGDISLKAFYIRRILRIWPLYFAALLAGFLRSYTGHLQHYPLAFLFYVFLAGNWYCAIYGFPLNPILPLWSISVEEQFYLFIPLSAKRGGHRMLVIVAAVLVIFFLICLAVLVHLHAVKDDAVWTNSFVQFSAFASGLLLAVWLHLSPRPKSSLGMQVSLGSAAAALLVGASLIFHIRDHAPATSWVSLALGYIAVSVGCAMCIYVFLIRPWKPFPFLIYLGKISYGLYVFHSWAIGIAKVILLRFFPSIEIDSVPYFACLLTLSFLGTLFMASLSYRYLESPFLRLKDRFAIVHSRPV